MKSLGFEGLRALLAGFVLVGLAAVPVSVAAVDDDAVAVSDTTDPGVTEPGAFIEDLVEKLKLLAEDEAGTDDARQENLRLVLAEDMATRRLQRYLLSNEQRGALSEEEISQYNNVFPRYISSAFAGSIDQLVSRTIVVNDVIERRPGDFVVRSKLYSSDGEERAGLDWRVREQDGRKLLVDVMVDGLSFSVERRAQFTSVIKKDGFEALIDHMKEVAGETP